MRKLKLDLDSLEVQSFATREGDTQRGTAYGYVSNFSCVTRCDSEFSDCPSEWETICTYTELGDFVCRETDRGCETTEPPTAWCIA